MKKHILFALSLILALSLFGCQKKQNENPQTTQPSTYNPTIPYDYKKDYNELLADIYNNSSDKNNISYFIKDLDNNGVNELVTVRVGTEITVYTYKDKVYELGKNDFLTGTLQLFYTDDSAYPGIIYFTVGGGAEHYGYLTVKNDQLSFEKLWDNNYSNEENSGNNQIVEFTTDKKLIEKSKNAYSNNQTIEKLPLKNVISE